MLIQGRAGTIWDAAQRIEEIEGVQTVHTVTGPYDIIVYAELPSAEGLRSLTKQIHDIDGVERTETCIAM